MNCGSVFLVLFVLTLIVEWIARREQSATGLPQGRLVYADTTRWRPVERPLFSKKHHLVGQPDYLVTHKGVLVPVEIKSGVAPTDGPYTSHVLQLASYCLLAEEEFGQRPPFGLIVYADDAQQTYQVDYTPALEKELLAAIDRMRCELAQGSADRDHDQAARCRACNYRYRCDQSLI